MDQPPVRLTAADDTNPHEKESQMDGEHRFEIEPSESETPRPRSKWASCLIGCLVVLGVFMVVAIVAIVWLARNFRGWVADFGSHTVTQGIDASDLPPQEKVEIKAEVERVGTAFREGRISMEQAATIFEKVVKSPLMPSLAVAAVDKHYFERSGLNDDEKAEGRVTLHRFARGMIDEKIEEEGIDAVMAHVADRDDDSWRLRQQVSDEDLRAALAAAKSQADEAGIAAEPEEYDPSDELKRIIDESMNEHD